MKEEVVINILQHCRLCRGLNVEEIQKLCDGRDVTIKEYDKGNVIFSEGSEPKAIYILLGGTVSISKIMFSGRRVMVTRIERPGDIFGEVYVFMEKQEYEVQAETMEKSVVLELRCEALRESSTQGSDSNVLNGTSG